jgi:hypothetical protein
MNELTLEWLQKAEGDYATAGRETRARRQPNYDAACFHAQQTAEKYLKALLHEHGASVPRTHSLIELLEITCVCHLAGARGAARSMSQSKVAPKWRVQTHFTGISP